MCFLIFEELRSYTDIIFMFSCFHIFYKTFWQEKETANQNASIFSHGIKFPSESSFRFSFEPDWGMCCTDLVWAAFAGLEVAQAT